jgi:hypothetical protein
MNNKLISILFCIILLFAGCKKDTDSISLNQNLEPAPSSFPNLNGTYSFHFYESWNDGLYERSQYDSWHFDKTRKAWNYSCYWSYTESDGWYNSLKKGRGFDMEWKIENGFFMQKLWNNRYSNYTSHSFEYIDNNSFKLNDKLYKKD